MFADLRYFQKSTRLPLPPMNPPFVDSLRFFILLCAVVIVLVSTAAIPSTDASDESPFLVKRNWNKANGLWGKRSAPSGDDMTMWKRPDDWTKLNSLWGKRSSWATANGLWGKRASWQTANGLWGKRSAPAVDFADDAVY